MQSGDKPDREGSVDSGRCWNPRVYSRRMVAVEKKISRNCKALVEKNPEIFLVFFLALFFLFAKRKEQPR